MQVIPSWSHSRIVEFEKCKRKIWLAQVEKVPELERPLPPGKTEHANDRGSRIHEEAERFVRGTGPLPPEAKCFSAELHALQSLYAEGRVSLEGEWAMNRAWQPCSWRGEWETIERPPETLVKKVKTLPEFGKTGEVYLVGKEHRTWVPPWLRLKLDALVHISETEAIAIDYKSGRKFGNELKHAEQLQLYQLVTFLRYPKLELVHTELWYFDQDDLMPATFQRKHGLRFQRSWDQRGNNLTTCEKFPPNANKFSCKWCDYGPWGTGHCPEGVR